MDNNTTDILTEVRERLALLLHERCEPDDHLFTTGRLNSVTLMEAVGWAGSRYGVEIFPEELSIANFDTPRRFAAYLQSKLGNG